MVQCQVCSNTTGNRTIAAREMYYGFRDRFEYMECGACGALQIIDPPADLSPYYPGDYYSFHLKQENFVKHYLKRKRADYTRGKPTLVGKFAARKWGTTPIINWLDNIQYTPDSRILDVGTGAGALVLDMHAIGFRNVSGIDPYIRSDIHYPDGPSIYKKELAELNDAWDIIMMHHSFEHTAEPLVTLQHINRLLPVGGYALIRMPVAGTWAWRTFGSNWVQLDAPRHLNIQSLQSMQLLAQRAGFRMEHIVFDSNEYQFWASEQYGQDIAYCEERSLAINPKKSLFTPARIKEFKARAPNSTPKTTATRLVIFYVRSNYTTFSYCTLKRGAGTIIAFFRLPSERDKQIHPKSCYIGHGLSRNRHNERKPRSTARRSNRKPAY